MTIEEITEGVDSTMIAHFKNSTYTTAEKDKRSSYSIEICVFNDDRFLVYHDTDIIPECFLEWHEREELAELAKTKEVRGNSRTAKINKLLTDSYLYIKRIYAKHDEKIDELTKPCVKDKIIDILNKKGYRYLDKKEDLRNPNKCSVTILYYDHANPMKATYEFTYKRSLDRLCNETREDVRNICTRLTRILDKNQHKIRKRK